MTKIDILLPYWGEFDLLKKTIDSVLAQNSEDWKLHIFDDHYPSLEAKKYISSLNDDRITYFRHEKNIGITNNFNYALQYATSEFCMLLGCDDQLLPNYVSRALQNIGDADLYQPNVEVIDENGVVYLPLGDRIKKLLRPRKQALYSGEKLATSLSHGNWLYFPSITWKSETIKKHGFDTKYKIAEDVVLEFTIIKDGGSLYLDNEITFQYRRFANSLSSKEKGKGGVRFNEEDEVYNAFADIFHSIGWRKAARAAHVRFTARLHKLLTR